MRFSVVKYIGFSVGDRGDKILSGVGELSCSPTLEPVMNFDRILLQLGEFGPWQRRNNLLMWIPSTAAGINVLIAAFAVMGPRNGYRCRNKQINT